MADPSTTAARSGRCAPHLEMGFYGQHDAPGRRGFRLGRRRQAQSALYQPRHSDQGNDLVAARRAADAQAWRGGMGAYRHSMGALRFVARGNPKAYTIVDGEKLYMEENDL